MAERIDTAADNFDDSPEGQHRYWMVEIDAAREHLDEWRERAAKANDRFLDVRDTKDGSARKLNLYTSSTQTLRAMLYGKVPQVTVSRRFGDARDDVARVAGELMERTLNSDIERDGDGFRDAIGTSVDDRLIPGLGQVRLRYVCEMGEREVPPKMAPMPMAAGTMPDGAVPLVEVAAGYVEKYKVSEDVETDYVHWRDFLWSPCRTWAECRWVAFGVPMTRADLVARFPEDGERIPLDSDANYKTAAEAQEIDDVWGRAYVWEVWDESKREVVWLTEGYAKILDRKPDPLGLAGFFPCPKPMVANATTTAFVPVPDYYFAQDQYLELDDVTDRISALQEALRVRGGYNEANKGMEDILKAADNTLVPVKNWALEVGKGEQIIWVPLEVIWKTLQALEQYRQGLVQYLYQITGLSDVIRGQATGGSATATEQSIKAKFASVRLQALQDEVSRFASDAQRIRAEIVVKHFDDEAILARANYAGGNDEQFIGPALQLLRDKFLGYRVEIAPDNINLSDAAQLKSERMEALQMVGGFLSNTAELAQMNPKIAPLLTEMLAWAFAGFKGSTTIEGSLDRYVAGQQEQAQQPPQPRPPPPQVMVAQMKAKGEQEKIRGTLQADLIRTQAETQAAIATQRAQLEADLTTKRADEDAKMRAEERARAAEVVDSFTRGGV